MRSGWHSTAPRTLAHVAQDGRAVSVTCRRCHHSDTLYTATLIDRLGSAFLVKDLEPRLRCTECRALGMATVWESGR